LLDVTLNAVCKVRRKVDSSDAQQVDGEEMSGWEQYMNCCALVTNSMITS